MTMVATIFELAAAGLPAAASAVFGLELVDADPLVVGEHALGETVETLGVARERVERQRLVYARDVLAGREAVFNPLRARRAAEPAPEASAPIDCRWCDRDGWHVAQTGRWTERFGDVVALDGRVCARPNWARQAASSGIVFGDERMHDLLRLGRDEFVALFEAAEAYIAAARAARSALDHFMVFANGGQRAAASVEHAHLQVVGRAGRHFAWAEHTAAVAPPDYWARLRAAHAALSLLVDHGSASAWATLVPTKERDVTVMSRSLASGAALVHDVMQALVRQGSNTFSIAAILAPFAARERFAGWPPVVWRLLDRGDRAVRHSDIGCMELFGTPVIATDPFAVAGWIGARS
jgi:hypothetical protein